MYCRNCGKEISDDSKFCQHCGTMQETNVVPESIQEELRSEVIETDIPQEYVNEEEFNTNQQETEVHAKSISTGAYLGRRLLGTIIDKIAILAICFIVILFICIFDSNFTGELGIFSALFHMTTDNVHSVAIGHVMPNYPDDYMSQHQYEIDEYFMYLFGLELKITSIFVLINLFYYVLCELIISSSVGKKMCRLRLISAPYDSMAKISPSKIFFRAFCFLLIVGGIIALRWVVGFNYYVVIILFFLIMDLPVFFKRQSLLDLVSRSKLLYENIQSISPVNKKAKVVEYNIEDKKDEYKKTTGIRNRSFILWCVFFLLTLISTHHILTYFFADYYYASNYIFGKDIYKESESDNVIRKKYVKYNKYWNEFPDEKFAISRRLPHTHSDGYWRNPIYGPIPNGKIISTYEAEGKESYIGGYHPVLKFRHEDVPKYKTSIYGYKIFDGFEDKKVYFKTNEPYYLINNYKNAISTYSIGGIASFFTSSKWVYDRCLNELKKELATNKIAYYELVFDGKKAIRYLSKDGSLCRVVICANGNAYLLETKSTVNNVKQSENLLSCVSFNHFQIISGNIKIITLFCLIIICTSIMVLIFTRLKHKSETDNRYAYSLFILSIASIIVNIVIALYQAYILYAGIEASVCSVIVLAGSLLTVISVSVPLCVFFYKRSKTKWEKDYIVPSLLRKMHYNKISKDLNKGTYVLYICKPLMVLSLLPLGVYMVLLYCVPMLIICSILIWFNKWRNWVKGSKA